MTASRSVPPQQEGIKADIIEMRTAADVQEAKLLFLHARERLYDVTRWGDISEGISATFTLTDSSGELKDDFPTPGDHIRIDIPGPGSTAGDGFDWVKVELVEDKRQPDADEE